MATVIFADGSKHLAHNLDDLSFRWQERKIAQAEEVLDVTYKGIVIRDCSNPSSVEQAREWKNQLNVQQMALQQYQHILEQRGFPSKSAFKRAVAPLRAGITEIIAQHSNLKHYIRENDPDYARNQSLAERVEELERVVRLLLEELEALKAVNR